MKVPAVGWGVRPVGVLTALEADEVRRSRRSPRDWLVDALCFLLAVGFTVLTFVDGLDRHLGPVPLAVDVSLGGLSCLGVWWRRRWPVGFAVTAIVFSVFSTAASGVALIALFTVAVYRRFAVVGLVTAGFALASIGTVLVRPDTSVSTWSQAALGIVCVAAVLAWGMFVRGPTPARPVAARSGAASRVRTGREGPRVRTPSDRPGDA